MTDLSKKLGEYFKRGVNYEYFFNNISSPELLPELIEAGFYKTPLKPVRKDGYIYDNRWAPLEYLIKIADKKPREVMDLILSMPATENISVNAQYIEAAMKMPPAIAKEINKKVATWSDLLPAFRLSYTLADLLNFYIEHDEIEPAITLLKIMTPLNRPTNPENLLINHPVPLIDRHEFEEILEKQVPALFKKDPVQVTNLLNRMLNRALEIEEKNKEDGDGNINDYSEIWLSDFNKPHLNTHLTVKIAVSLYEQVKSVKDNAKLFKELVESLSQEKYKVLQRMAATLIGEGSKDPDLKKIYSSFVKKWGKPNLPGMVEFTSWTGPDSPISIESIRKLSNDELVKYLQTWKPSGEIMSPSKEGLARVVSQLIEEDYKVGLLLLEKYSELDSIYTSHILQSLRMMTDNKKDLDWSAVIPAIKSLSSRKFDTDSEKDNWQLNSLLSLIESGLNHDQIDLSSEDTRKVIMTSIHKGLASSDPSAKREEKLSIEPDTLAINSTRGMALMTLIRYLKAFSRQNESKKEALAKLPKAELQEINDLLNYYVDVDKEPTLAVRTAFGQELPFLYYANQGWVDKNITKIFPRKLKYFKASMESLVLFSKPYEATVSVIHPYFLRYLQQIRQGNIKLSDTHTQTELVAHLMIYYLNGYIKHDDALISELHQLPGTYSGIAIEFIGRNLRDMDYAQNKKIFERAKVYWENRVKAGLKREEAEQFAWWYLSDGLDLNWRTDNMILALHSCSEVEALWFVLDWITKNSEEFPEITLKILKEIVKTQSDEKLRFLIFKETKAVLSSLYASTDTSIKAQARDVVERLLAKGYTDFKDILDKSPKA